MSDFVRFLAVQHARRLFADGVDLAIGCRVASELYGVGYVELLHLTGDAVEACGLARRALTRASPSNDTSRTDDAKANTSDAPVGGDEEEVEREIADWIEQRGNTKKKR